MIILQKLVITPRYGCAKTWFVWPTRALHASIASQNQHYWRQQFSKVAQASTQLSKSTTQYVQLFSKNKQLLDRAEMAERALKQLEDKITFVNVDLDETGGKTKKTREEPKDFSRIIAANIISSVNMQRTNRDNGTRILIAFIGLMVAFLYKLSLDRKGARLVDQQDEIDRQRKEIKQREDSIISREAELNQADDMIRALRQEHRYLYTQLDLTREALNLAEKTVKTLCQKDKICFENYKHSMNEIQRRSIGPLY